LSSESYNRYADGQVTLTEDFDYAKVSRALGETWEEPEVNDDIHVKAQDLAKLFQWHYQGECKDLDGWNCRAIILDWIFVPQLRSYSMTEMAGRFGKKKQSLGRWVDDFKKTFPELKHLSHFRT
jgi:hypothetical protein